MPSCPSCGNDVEKSGLCPECQKEKTGKKGSSAKSAPVKINPAIFVAGGLLVVAITIVIVVLTLGSAGKSNTSETNGKTESGDTTEAAEGTGTQTSSAVVSTVLTYDLTKRTNLVPVDNKENYINWMLTHTQEKREFLDQRWGLAQNYIETKELEGETIRAFLLTPREDFCRQQNINRAYADTWMPIGYGATITDPDVVCMMTTALKVEPHHRVLEIGTGSGYQSAILSNLSNYVYSIEIIEVLAKETHDLYKSLEEKYPQYTNIHTKIDDGYYGWEEFGLFDRIIITCAIDHLPPTLLKQLAPNGIMVVPEGPPGRQHIMQVTVQVGEDGQRKVLRKDVYNGLGVKFIPFRDQEGNSHNQN